MEGHGRIHGGTHGGTYIETRPDSRGDTRENVLIGHTHEGRHTHIRRRHTWGGTY